MQVVSTHMKKWLGAALFVFVSATVFVSGAELTPPKAGKPAIMPLKDLKPGMQATAWTVFKGNTAEPVPVEIIGVWKNAMGPRQHVIMAKMGGKAERTGVAGGMSGSPVYVDGKLIGAVATILAVDQAKNHAATGASTCTATAKAILIATKVA